MMKMMMRTWLSGATALAVGGAILLTAPGLAQSSAQPQARSAPNPENPADPSAQLLETIAKLFVQVALETGTFDPEFVDAYYGDAAERARIESEVRSIDVTRILAQSISHSIDNASPRFTPLQQRRLAMLRGQARAAETRLRMVQGERFSFADEARGLFGVTVETRPLSSFDATLARLEGLIPGEGPLAARVDAFNERYTIPAERLRPVFDAAIAECRRRTAQHFTLPEGESFTMEFVTGKPWSGYNYYQGGYRSLIQINTDLPIRISRAVDLGCHEGYPGHHVLNLMIEQRLVNQRGWREYQVNPLYSPQSVISEGSANYGIDLAFPGPERLAFERDVLYPLAGLYPATAEAYWQVQQATEGLGGARLTIAKMYLDGEITRAEALELSQKYLLLSPARAEQSVAFTDHYRSYVLNYGWGKDLVRRYIERGNADSATRWQRMEAILSEPTLPSDLMVGE